MGETTYRDEPRLGRRARRKQRALDRRALRAEFELGPRRRFAALRALLTQIGELEGARIRAYAEPAESAPPAAQGAAAPDLVAKRARRRQR
ncbi:MAG TPA: hypothetical protein VG186_08525 [Solirubrobacteraceae bacterium]|nr:hypothetical protein [Solirubrobacteraceae bacterium]